MQRRKQALMEKQQDLGPLFKDVRRSYDVSLESVIDDLVEHGVMDQTDITYDAIQLFDQLNIGREEVVEVMIESLSRLTGRPSTRHEIGFMAVLPME